MNQDDRYHVNRIVDALESILKHCEATGTQIPSELLNNGYEAISGYNKHNLIKLYKEQERKLYKTNKDQYYQIRKMRLELEDGHQ